MSKLTHEELKELQNKSIEMAKYFVDFCKKDVYKRQRFLSYLIFLQVI